MAFVEFCDVHKTYTMGEVEVRAADGVNLEIEQGELTLIVGPSGAGKSTILNMLGGMDSPTSGSIYFNGQDIARYNKKELCLYRRHDIGFVFQFYNLIQNLTALENVELATHIAQAPLDPRQVLESVGLGHRLKNFPSQLSGGEQQRVAIARALAKNPQLLLCDEPTGALDYETGKAILGLLQDAAIKEHKTVVIITHNSAFAPLAHKLIHIREGKVADCVRNDSPAPAATLEW